MHPSLLEFLRCPTTGEPLELRAFARDASAVDKDDVEAGVLLGIRSGHAYAIDRGVPVMVEGPMPPAFVARYREALQPLVPTQQLDTRPSGGRWSFSVQWEEQDALDLKTTWGFTPESRVEQTLVQTNRPREWFEGRTLLDAGCGNGWLTDRLTDLGLTTIGIDFSDSVFRAQRQRRSPNVHYVRGDLLRLPLAPESIDVVVSNGVLHHTPDTRRAFMQVSRCIKDEGVFFLWLYCLPETFFRRYVYYGLIDTARYVLSRSPRVFGRMASHIAARAVQAKYRLLGRHLDATYPELVLGMMDTLTPRWRHYHTPIEVAHWCFDAGFSDPTVTQWDDPYGFGVVTTRTRAPRLTPGKRFDQLAQQARAATSPAEPRQPHRPGEPVAM
jgi:SAM-dependent methyltransferase/uncharacterized protein YbaR (Trm112 family)